MKNSGIFREIRELDIHGYISSEAYLEVDAFLREAHAEGERRVRVVHGRGAGILANTVADVCAQHPCVKDFYFADIYSGGSGATMIELI